MTDFANLSSIEGRRDPFVRMPESIFRFHRMSLGARLVAGYMAGRPPGWQLHLTQVQKVLGIGDTAWRSICRELKACGVLLQERKRCPKTGKLIWTNSISDSPFKSASIPRNPVNGDATSTGAQDKAAQSKSNEFNKVASSSTEDSSCIHLPKAPISLLSVVVIENDVDRIRLEALAACRT